MKNSGKSKEQGTLSNILKYFDDDEEEEENEDYCNNSEGQDYDERESLHNIQKKLNDEDEEEDGNDEDKNEDNNGNQGEEEDENNEGNDNDNNGNQDNDEGNENKNEEDVNDNQNKGEDIEQDQNEERNETHQGQHSFGGLNEKESFNNGNNDSDKEEIKSESNGENPNDSSNNVNFSPKFSSVNEEHLNTNSGNVFNPLSKYGLNYEENDYKSSVSKDETTTNLKSSIHQSFQKLNENNNDNGNDNEEEVKEQGIKSSKNEVIDNQIRNEEQKSFKDEEKNYKNYMKESEEEEEEEDESEKEKRINQLRLEMIKKEEELKAQLAKKQKELEEEMRKKELQDKIGTQSHKENEQKQIYIPKKVPSMKISKTSLTNENDPSKRASLLLRSKKEELEQTKSNEKEKKSIFDEFNEEVLKDKYLIDEKKFDELTKKDDINSKNLKKYFTPALYNDMDTFKFHPEINERSKNIVKQKEIEMNSYNNPQNRSRSKSPIELTLYDDAVKRRQKLQKIDLNTEMNIKLNSNKTKISNNSHKIYINKLEKTIDDTVALYSKDNTLSFLNIAQILTSLKIFREILKNKETNKEIDKIKDLKEKISKVRDQEIRKIEEINFLEQVWICLDPQNEEYIKSEVFREFLKILFSPVESSVKEIATILKPYLQAALFLNNNKINNKYISNISIDNKDKSNDSFNSDNINPGIVSPITEKLISAQDIWDLNTLVKHFLILKENIIAYKPIRQLNPTLKKELIAYSKQMTFRPIIEKNKYRAKIFEKKLPNFLERENLRKLALEELRKEKKIMEMEECTFKPEINRKYNDNSFCEKDKISVYDKLYKKAKDHDRKRKEVYEEKLKENKDNELNLCTFKPKLNLNKNLNKSFEIREMPNGFFKHVEHTRRGIIERYRKKYMEEKRPVGENYEKVRAQDIKPFNITDIRKQEKLKLKEITKRNNLTFEDSESESDGNDDYFTIEAKIPNGKKRVIKVYCNDDPKKIAENFCKTYCIKDEIKRKLSQRISNYKRIYLENMKNNDYN